MQGPLAAEAEKLGYWGPWGPSIKYDTGGPNAISLNNNGQCVEVHVGSGLLYYRVGKVDFAKNAISWGTSTQYDAGGPNAISMDDNGQCVEVHVEPGDPFGVLYYRVGKVDFAKNTISWGTSTQYDTGGPNAISLNNNGKCVEVHVGSGLLYYRVGKVDFAKNTISWGTSTQYGTGGPNAISLNDNEQCAEVHVEPGDPFNVLYYRVGKVDFAKNTISWGTNSQYDTGGPNSISMDNNGQCIEVHVGTEILYSRVGKANFAQKTISWEPSTRYDVGGSNSVSMNDSIRCVEVHAETNNLYYRVR